MTIWQRIKTAFGVGQRSYGAARVGRMTNDWTTSVTSANKEIKGDLKTLRARARQLERDNDYIRRYLKALEKQCDRFSRHQASGQVKGFERQL